MVGRVIGRDWAYVSNEQRDEAGCPARESCRESRIWNTSIARVGLSSAACRLIGERVDALGRTHEAVVTAISCRSCRRWANPEYTPAPSR